MSNYEKLVQILKEIFQLDQADLDFGIYRIMNQKRDEIETFLTKDLLPQVGKSFEKYSTHDKATIQNELDKTIENAKSMGVDPDTVPRVNELKVKYSLATDVSQLENEVFSLLANFFRRYYKDGDFISMRRYKKDVYAIPYEGEEVKLHWANHDQYYIKTSEYFKHYSFKLNDGKKVSFELIDAETEQNNNKEQEGKERKFVIINENPLLEDDEELKIFFSYEANPEKQESLTSNALEILIPIIPQSFYELLSKRPTEKNKNRTLLEKHIRDYTARNTFDYFIHKDLGKFLRRELDFYIKNEVLYIDDINTQEEAEFTKQLSKIKALKDVANKIISFLEQLENFQKKLWLKQKFVVETNYCITLDRIPEELYHEIVENKKQIDEWINLFDIDDIKTDKVELFDKNIPFTNPLTIEFLKDNPSLILDTSYFSNEFVHKLISSINNIDSQMNGVLIHSENFQAIKFIGKRYKNEIRAIYIDPPYNTPHSEILYKNQFKHSSWLSLINNTVPLTTALFESNHSFAVAIDDYELPNVLIYLNRIFPELDISVITVNHHPQGSGGKLSRTNDYLIICTNADSPDLLGKVKKDSQEERSFMRSGTADNNYRTGRWKSFYALLVDQNTMKIIDAEDPIPLGEDYPTSDTVEGCKRIYPINSKGEERVWRASYLTGRQRARNGELFITNQGAVKQKIDHESKREVLFSNWIDSKFNAGTHGASLLTDMGLGQVFDYPKSIYTMETTLYAQSFNDSEAIILDYFGGSGTTAHAVINMNKEDHGNRKYILVEMGEYINIATKPRIKKAIYSKKWKDGKPVSREGSSHCFKYIRLESYEDTLNNLELKRDSEKQSAIDFNTQFKEDYLLSYMLDVESEGSASLLNINEFSNPYDYKLKVIRNNETQTVNVDLPETFNYLIGLVVETIDELQGFKVITGRTLQDEKILVIWRNIEDKDNKTLDNFFLKQQYNTRDSEFDRIYVNGDNNLENLKIGDEKWKVVLIEEEFKKRMFDVKEF